MDDSPLLPRTLSLAVHEFLTPLSVALGYSRMLLNEQAGPLTDKQKELLEGLHKSCGRISGLVDELRDLGRLEGRELALAKQDVDVSSLMQELASGMHEGDDRGVRIDVHAADRPLVVTGDRARLARAFGALMRAAMRERSSGVVTAYSGSAEYAGARWAVLAIGDESEIESLRQMGDTQDFNEWHGGLGLALPVARRIIEAHGGAIWSAANPRSKAASALRLPLRTQV